MIKITDMENDLIYMLCQPFLDIEFKKIDDIYTSFIDGSPSIAITDGSNTYEYMEHLIPGNMDLYRIIYITNIAAAQLAIEFIYMNPYIVIDYIGIINDCEYFKNIEIIEFINEQLNNNDITKKELGTLLKLKV